MGPCSGNRATESQIYPATKLVSVSSKNHAKSEIWFEFGLNPGANYAPTCPVFALERASFSTDAPQRQCGGSQVASSGHLRPDHFAAEASLAAAAEACRSRAATSSLSILARSAALMAASSRSRGNSFTGRKPSLSFGRGGASAEVAASGKSATGIEQPLSGITSADISSASAGLVSARIVRALADRSLGISPQVPAPPDLLPLPAGRFWPPITAIVV
jgi:hypothetical protein